MIHALSIDLEDWYHGFKHAEAQRFQQLESRIEHTTQMVLDLLGNVKATFFVLGRVAEQYPHLIRQIHSEGHEIGVHSHAHHTVYEQTSQDFKADLDRVLTCLKELIGNDIFGYRAPRFSITKKSLWALDILCEAGLKYDSSIFPTLTTDYGIADAPRFAHPVLNSEQKLWEIPPSTVKFFGKNLPCAGGFYTRAMPYAYTKWGISKVAAESQPAVMYFHPWEFDPGAPRPKLTLRDKLIHYYGLKGMQRKFKRLLSDFEFAPICQVFNIQ